MSAASRATSFTYGKETYVLLFCPRCTTGPIIVSKKVYGEIAETGLTKALLCKQCSRRPK